MKKILLLIFLLLPSIYGRGEVPQNPDLVVEQVIIKSHGLKGHRMPSLTPLTFDCTLFRVQETLILTASRECEATVQILNCTTGQSIVEDTTLNATPHIFSVMGSGHYVITITLASGQEYEGEFEL